MIHHTKKWPNQSNQFFELFRFDFVFDSQLNPFLMEVNMSPNLSGKNIALICVVFFSLISSFCVQLRDIRIWGKCLTTF
jgi:hypothetical protein